ncbi:MAG: RNA polymerase sigma-70 factor [Niabella sp.]|nr:RNA polymerase sigma-70 factor [Niabella sp.]
MYNHFFPGLFSFAQSIIDDKFKAEEIIEDVFVKLWESKKMLPTITNLSHYLYIAVKHGCLNAVTRRKTTEELMPSADFQYKLLSTGDFIIEKENLAKINQAIEDLPEKCRLIFRLVKSEGLKYKEVAQLLDISVKTVDAQMYIAIQKIIATLKITLPEFSHYYRKKNISSL